MIFDNLYKDWYLAESVLDIPREGLDPDVFQFPDQGEPIINARIKQQIIDGVTKIHLVVPVQDYFVIGSILTTKYNKHSDIDVTCEVDTGINPIALENLMSLLKHINGKLAIGTMHPINFYIVKGQFDHDKTEAIYDIANDVWIKTYRGVNFNVKRFMDKLKLKLRELDLTTAELRRDLIDFEEIKSLSKEETVNVEYELSKILKNIDSDISKIVDMYDNAKLIRKRTFNREMTPAEIRKFGVKNNLPENILYKMLERYFYSELAKNLKKSISDDEKVEVDDIPSIRKSFNDFIKKI